MYRHRPHLNHGPLCGSILMTLVRLCVAVTFQPQIEYGTDCFIVGCLCLFLPSYSRQSHCIVVEASCSFSKKVFYTRQPLVDLS